MNMRVEIGGVKITSEKMDKLKNSDDISSALTLWEKIKKFFHVGNIEEKENILSLIKDVFINNDLNLYQKVGKFEEIKSLTKTQEAKDFFKIEIIDESLCLSIGNYEESIKYVFIEDRDKAEIEKLKNILNNTLDNIKPINISRDNYLNKDCLLKCLISSIINKKETYSFDETGGINIDNIENLLTDLINIILSEIKDKIKENKIDNSIFKEDVINILKKEKIKYFIEPDSFLKILNEAIDSDKKMLQENETFVDKIKKTVITDLPRMEYFISNKKINNDDFEKIETIFKKETDEKKELIYNLISQGVFQLVKDSLLGDDPIIAIGLSPLKGCSKININKDGDNINIKAFNKKALEATNKDGVKNASIFLSKYINENLSPYTQDHVNLLCFLTNNLEEKPSNRNDILKAIENNKLLSVYDNMIMLEEEAQLTFTYNLNTQQIVIDKKNSYYEYSYLNT